MYYYLIPVFQSVLSETRDLLTSQGSINYVNSSVYNNPVTGEDFTWNWNDYYKYASLEGLHLCEAFEQNINQVPIEKFYYDHYIVNGRQFSTSCQ